MSDHQWLGQKRCYLCVRPIDKYRHYYVLDNLYSDYYLVDCYQDSLLDRAIRRTENYDSIAPLCDTFEELGRI